MLTMRVFLLLLVLISSAYAEDAVVLCDASKGFQLLNQEYYLPSQLKMILEACDIKSPNAPSTLLLHGLFARKEAQKTKQYSVALYWLHKAQAAAPKNNAIALELAATYELDNNLVKAQEIYTSILSKNPQNRSALVGQARVLRLQSQFVGATDLYWQMLKSNPSDIDALNGLGWINASKKNYQAAASYFQAVLQIMPENQEALTAMSGIKATQLQQLSATTLASALEGSRLLHPISLCDADKGLMLLNQKNPPLTQINAILRRCDANTPKAISALLLHGLLARYDAKRTHNYSSAIDWLTKAAQLAPPGNKVPLIELAITYEWAGQPQKALAIYQGLLAKSPNDKTAILGKARVLRMEYKIPESLAIYQDFLKKHPKDVTALNGYGESLMANYQFEPAKAAFNKALTLNPGNLEAITDLKTLKTASKYVLSITGGNYSVPPEVSNGINVYFFDQINATEGLTFLATHNTKQIGEDFFSGQTLLPNYSFLLGYQNQIPNQYGWGISYDFREHDKLELEQRILAVTNVFLNKNVEWFNGFRMAFTSPWNTGLLYSGLTVYTSLPVNVTFTGFWANQENAGKSSSYSLDFSKEYANRFYYNVGPSYSPTLHNWEFHGKLTIPTVTNQAIIADCSHYLFNNSTFVNVGWKIYWA